VTKSDPTSGFAFGFDSGDRALFVDPRRFGTGVVLLGDEARERVLRRSARSRATQPGVHRRRPTCAGGPAQAARQSLPPDAGACGRGGNIYADEALFRARIHPLRPVGTLKRSQIADLRDAVVESLSAGIDAKGATIDDFATRRRSARSGRFPRALREGEPCVRCGRRSGCA